MRRYLAVVLGCLAAAAPPDVDAGHQIAAAAMLPRTTLSVIPADDAGRLRWATWDEKSSGAATSRMALLDTRGSTGLIAWQTEVADAYAPALRLLPSWTYEKRPVVALTVQFGAAAAEVRIYGLDARDRPVLLADRLGAAVGWSASHGGDDVLVVYTASPTLLVPSCFVWSDPARLAEQACPHQD